MPTSKQPRDWTTLSASDLQAKIDALGGNRQAVGRALKTSGPGVKYWLRIGRIPTPMLEKLEALLAKGVKLENPPHARLWKKVVL